MLASDGERFANAEDAATVAVREFAPWSQRAAILLSFVLFAVAATAANWPDWPGDPSRINAGDFEQMAWFLAYTPFAVLHLHNPLATNFLNFPVGVNLAQNTSSPLLGLLTAPLTYLVSPLSSLSLLRWLGFFLSASSMYLVSRRLGHRVGGAFVAGALYAFGPYVVTQSINHLNLAFVPLPPVILLALYELLRPEARHRMRWGTVLGVSLAAQLFISAEVAFDSVLIGGIAALLVGLARPRRAVEILFQARQALLLAAALTALAALPLVWEMTAGAYRYHGPAYPGGVSSDLLSVVLPTHLQHFAPASWQNIGNSLLGGNITENGAYLGVPVLLLLLLIVWRQRKRPFVLLCGFMSLACIVLSLGPTLIVDNRSRGIWLPFQLLTWLPLGNNVIASRLSLFTALFTAILAAEGVSLFLGRPTPARTLKAPARALRFGALAVLVLLAVATLVPNWPEPTQKAEIPSYFRTADVEAIPTGSTVLMLPYAGVLNPVSMVEQAVARIRFRMIGGYALFRGPTGQSDNFPALLSPTSVANYLWKEAYGSDFPGVTSAPNAARSACLTQKFLRNQTVGTVIYPAAPVTGSADPVEAFISAALGPPVSEGGVLVWYDVQKLIVSHHC